METDHKLVWLSYEELKGNMFLEMQNWALDQYHELKDTEEDNAIDELTADEIDELVFEEQLASGEYDEEIP